MASSITKTKVGQAPSGWGMSPEELATYPTVFADNLLKGQVFIVSGGGSGMGKAMTFLLSRLGAQVVICGRREAKLEETVEQVDRLVGKTVHAHPMTIRDPEAVAALMEDTFERFGRLDTLVNNGGGQFPQAAIDFSVKGWNAVIDTNLNGSWYMMQAAARQWRDRGQQGHIVNIVANVWKGMPQVAHTCAARAGVIYLSKTLSTEWAPLGIRVNCVSPGSIETEGFDVYPPGAAERFKDSNPMRRTGDVFDIAQAVIYLAAPSGNFITGEVLVVDGGNQQWGAVWPGGKPDYFKIED
jgi:NAD(P)-dependent dehydrogenase (short-subunit alcohol dehydrogenase family)